MTAPGGWELVTSEDEQNPTLGDLKISRTRLATIAQFGDAVRQAVSVRLRWWRGEWFLDTRQGVPYLDNILIKGVTEQSVRAVLKKEIEAVEGVARVTSLTVSIDRATRYAEVDIEIETTEGESLVIEGVPVGT